MQISRMQSGTILFQFALLHLVNLLEFYVFLFCDFFFYYLFNSLVYFSSPVFATDFSFKLPVFLQNEIAQIYFSMVLGSLFPHYCIYCK